MQEILNRSSESAAKAIAFIGAGRVAESFAQLKPAEVYLIGTSDDQIAATCRQLAASGVLNPTSIVFHCSGALGSRELDAASQRGAAVASIHPIRSFASPEHTVANFAGTFCGVEGDARALALLNPRFEAIGAKTVAIDGSKKVLYHGAAVLASNYLVTLMDMARNTYVEAGVAPDLALAMLEPLVRGTVDNILHSGPEAALTGPIARGDMATVARQHAAMSAWRSDYGDLYAAFATLTAELAARKKNRR